MKILIANIFIISIFYINIITSNQKHITRREIFLSIGILSTIITYFAPVAAGTHLNNDELYEVLDANVIQQLVQTGDIEKQEKSPKLEEKSSANGEKFSSNSNSNSSNQTSPPSTPESKKRNSSTKTRVPRLLKELQMSDGWQKKR